MIETILKEVENNSGYNIKDIRRLQNLILLRGVYYKLSRENTDATFDSIGKLVGKSHASVMNSYRRIDKDLKQYKMYNVLYNHIKDKLFVKTEKEVVSLQNYTEAFNELLNLNNNELSDFEETRLKPYLSMLKSKRVQQVKTVAGAKLNRTTKI